MTVDDTQMLELIALRLLPTASRCRSAEGERLTYRRSLRDVIPGMCLRVAQQRRWTFRHTDMVGGPLLHVGFSLRASELPSRSDFSYASHRALATSSEIRPFLTAIWTYL